MHLRKRFLYYDLVKYLNHKNSLVITGMRQVGKTTLMKQLFETVENSKIWFDFDNPLDTLIFENSNYDAVYFDLLKNCGGKQDTQLFVFIDEIQNFPDITKIIKYHIDKYNVKYIVTGSSNYYLRNLFPESLSGRKFLFVLSPMDFKEFLYFKNQIGKIEDIDYNINSDFKKCSQYEYKKFEFFFNEFFEFGGFPEVVVTENHDTKKKILKNIFSSFFEKDVKLLTDLKDIKDLRDLILLLAARTGNILDVSKLSSEMGINRVKMYSLLELLQGVFFVKLIPKFSKSIDRSVAGRRKVYFADNGLLNTISRLNESQLFENAVANQLEKYGELSYYNLRNTSEIDFILNKSIAFEVKLNAVKRDVERLKKISERLGINSYYVISKSYVDLENTIFWL